MPESAVVSSFLPLPPTQQPNSETGQESEIHSKEELNCVQER